MVSYLEGRAFTVSANEETPLDVGSAILATDTVKTGPKSVCEISFPSIGRIEIEADSIVKINSIEAGKAQVEATRGKLLAKVNKLSGQDRFSVKARSVVCGVRGTLFSVEITKSKKIQVAVAEGRVALYPAGLVTSGAYELGESTDLPLDNYPLLAAGHEALCDPANFNKAGESFVSPAASGGDYSEADVQASANALKVSEGAITESEGKSLDAFASRPQAERVEASVPAEPAAATVDARGKASAEMPNAEITNAGSVKVSQEQAPAEKNPSGANGLGPQGFRTKSAPITYAQESSANKANALLSSSLRSVKLNSAKATQPLTDKDIEVWTDGSNYSSEYADGHIKVTVLKGVTNVWDFKLHGTRVIPIKSKGVYEMEFTAWDSVPTIVYPLLQENGVDYDKDGDLYTPLIPNTPILLTNEPTRYSIPFSIDRGRDSKTNFFLYFGQNKSTVYLQDVAVTEREVGSPQLTDPLNGDFSLGMQSWDTWVGTDKPVSLTVKEGTFTMDSKYRLNDLWHIQLLQKRGIPLIKGARYVLSFDARNAEGGTLETIFTEYGKDINGDGDIWSSDSPAMNALLKPEWQHYSQEFIARSTDNGSRLCFDLGGLTGKTELDNISFVKL
jgi:hypothetical protein